MTQAQTSNRRSDDIRSVAPALDRYTRERLAGDLWKRPDLSPRDRSLVTVAALIARHHTAELPRQLELALDHGVKPGEISEVVTHLAFYAGWGTAMAAVPVAKDVFAQRGIKADQLPRRPATACRSTRPPRPARAKGVEANFGDVAPGVVQYTTDVLFRDLWLRPGLAPRDRSLVTVSALVAAGQVAQIPYHLNRAMDSGLTKAQASEALTQLAFYAGWPNVFSALPVAKDVFAKRPRLGCATPMTHLAPCCLGRGELLRAQRVRRIADDAAHRQVDERAHPRRQRRAAAVVDEDAEVVGHVLRQQRHQAARADVRRGGHARQLADAAARPAPLRISSSSTLVHSAGDDVVLDHAVADLDHQGSTLPVAGMAEHAAAVRGQVVRARRARHAARGRPAPRRRSSCSANSRRAITPSVAEAPTRKPTSTRSSTQLPMRSSSCTSGCTCGCSRQNSSSSGHSTGTKVERGPTMRNGPGDLVGRAPRELQRPLQAGERRPRRLEELPPLVGQRHAGAWCGGRAARRGAARAAPAPGSRPAGVMPCASAARRRLPSSAVFAKVVIERSSLIGMAQIIKCSLPILQGFAG